MSTRYFPGQGTQFVQRGLDLRKAPLLVGTGGPLVRRAGSERLLACAVARASSGVAALRRRPRIADRPLITSLPPPASSRRTTATPPAASSTTSGGTSMSIALV